jgi:serine/threonine-protein kinase
VVRSDPPSGTRLDPAAPAVTLIASNAVTVPPVTGMSVAMARNALEQLGLQVQVFAFFGADGSTVTDQRPDAGDLVEPGSTVQITAWP